MKLNIWVIVAPCDLSLKDKHLLSFSQLQLFPLPMNLKQHKNSLVTNRNAVNTKDQWHQWWHFMKKGTPAQRYAITGWTCSHVGRLLQKPDRQDEDYPMTPLKIAFYLEYYRVYFHVCRWVGGGMLTFWPEQQYLHICHVYHKCFLNFIRH